MLIGYARVSTDGQTTEPQRQALEAAGCAEVFEDVATGSHTKRDGLRAALARLQPGDVLTVWKLDRLARSLPDLLDLVQQIEKQGAGFRSLTEAIDTTSPGGRLVFHLFGALAEFERGLIVERTRAGMEAAKGRGVHLGRKPAITPAQLDHAARLIQQGEMVSSVAHTLRVDPSTLRRHFRARKLAQQAA